jgi:hypothetical protein
MALLNNMPSWTKEELAELLKGEPMRSLFEQQWTSHLVMAEPPHDQPRDAVRIHQLKGRGPSKAERLYGYELVVKQPLIEPKPEHPYKGDPRYGTWG